MNPKVPGQGEIRKTGQDNDAAQVFNLFHPKPICPWCRKPKVHRTDLSKLEEDE